jgi:Fe-Mn family superoxide dismutase
MSGPASAEAQARPGAEDRSGILAAAAAVAHALEVSMIFRLQPLPWPIGALADYMSAETLEYHHGRHHRFYVDKVSLLVAGTPLAASTLVDIVHAARLQGDEPLFNNAAQAWNHNFFWMGLAPPAGQRPAGELAERICTEFGSVDNLLEQLAAEAVGHFSNGWAWLVLDGDALRIRSLHDGDTPIVHAGMKPLLAIDVWEHAYYIDYRNARADFVRELLHNLVDWEFVAANLDGRGVRRADQKPAGTRVAARAEMVEA